VMQLEIRRIQKTGTSTMTVSLPKDWVEANKMKAGDPVEVRVIPDGTIVIDPRVKQEKVETRKTIWVDEDETKEHLTRKLIGAYLGGFSVVEVRGKERLSLDLKRAVKEISRMVIGPEVIEETSNTLVLHDLSDPIELPQEKCVRRMHLIVGSMHKDAIAALEQMDEELASDVIDRDADVDRLYWMAVKQHNLIMSNRKLSESIGVDIYGSTALMLAARSAERIGDHAEKIAGNVIIACQNRTKLGKVTDIGELSARSLSTLDRAMEAFFRMDIRAANALIDDAEVLAKDCQNRMNDLRAPGSAAAIALASVIDSISRTTMYAMDIAEVAINAAMRAQ